jgi:hypothetical protein
MTSVDYPYESEKYKLTLAMDLIVFLSSVIVSKMKKAESSDLLGKAMQLWNERIDKHMIEIKKEQTEMLANYAMDELDSPDVIDILIDAHQTLPTILKTEFVEIVLENIQKQVIEIKTE